MIRLVEVMGVDRQDQEQRKRFIRFTDADVQSLKVLGPFIESHVDEIVEEFYRNLLQFDEWTKAETCLGALRAVGITVPPVIVRDPRMSPVSACLAAGSDLASPARVARRRDSGTSKPQTKPHRAWGSSLSNAAGPECRPWHRSCCPLHPATSGVRALLSGDDCHEHP